MDIGLEAGRLSSLRNDLIGRACRASILSAGECVMDKSIIRHQLEDFKLFCDSVDIKGIVAVADEHGNAEGYEKELYAIAIMRAVQNGVFGSDNSATQTAISALWERGYRSGFNPDSYNAVFEKYFRCW
jgi:hypothetical protein